MPNSDGSSSPSFSYEELTAMLPAYVLGALEPEEMLAVDSQMQHSKRLLTQLERLENTSSQLALSAPEVEAPPLAKMKLMARIQTAAAANAVDNMAAAAQRPQTQPVAIPATVQPARNEPEARTVPVAKRQTWLDSLQDRLGSPLPWPALTAAMSAIVLLLALYTGWVQVRMESLAGQLGGVQETLAELRSQNEQLLTSNTQLQQQLRERENQLALFAGADRVIALEGTEEAPAASGAFYAGRESSVLVLRGLNRLPQEQTYELWLIPSDGAPVPAGLVEVDEQGMATLTVSMAERPADFAAIGISIEPAGGSPQPTGPIVLLGTSAS